MDPEENRVTSPLHPRISNRFENVLSSFGGKCRVLEWEAYYRKKLIDGNNAAALDQQIGKISNELSEYLATLNDACDKMVLTNSCFENRNLFTLSESIEIPYSIQVDTVDSLKKIYSQLKNDSENKVVDDELIESTSDAIRIVENNIGEFENFQNLYSCQI